MIVILISALVVLFIAVYLGYTAYGISKNKKIDRIQKKWYNTTNLKGE